jgi:beta-mannosidase
VSCAALPASQPEAFYEFCDENGLLIWQDAMFGGSHYPRTPEWLANYADEITQQVWAGLAVESCAVRAAAWV